MKPITIKLTLLAAAISSSMAVQAQSDDITKVERIQITGSHIKRTDMEGPSPITSLSAEDITKTGVTDLIGLFTKLPMAGQGTFQLKVTVVMALVTVVQVYHYEVWAQIQLLSL